MNRLKMSMIVFIYLNVGSLNRNKVGHDLSNICSIKYLRMFHSVRDFSEIEFELTLMP